MAGKHGRRASRQRTITLDIDEWWETVAYAHDQIRQAISLRPPEQVKERLRLAAHGLTKLERQLDKFY